MAFRFPLAAVLRLRRSLERREELALQRLLLACAQCKRRIEQLSDQIVELDRAREETLRRPTTAFQLQGLLIEARELADQRHLAYESLNALEQKRIKQLEVYQGACRDRKILSDLESRRHDEFNVQLERTQQKQVDDIFAARAHRS